MVHAALRIIGPRHNHLRISLEGRRAAERAPKGLKFFDRRLPKTAGAAPDMAGRLL